ncbi:GNAT family N-acetyltransferase [Cohnella sp. WQ 127256]|uniref:GNAT family N-acetyltransferase n=1 Tax=Cohnella sp. WQ 127256 TaxID=2938790 RepID=UPI0021184C7B|nr:GNAT family N-acetyltransferase [Cohnella sp. WQ 127256]
MIISNAQRSDLPKILQLQYEAYQSEAEIYQEIIPPLKQSLSELENEFNEGILLKVTIGDEIVGSVRALIQDGVCIIGKLIVKPEFQNQGIGKRLMMEIEAAYTQVKRKELFTGHKSIKNIELYKRLGYQKYKEIEVNEKLKMVHMYKEG